MPGSSSHASVPALAALLLLFGLVSSGCRGPAQPTPRTPVPRAHAHNDYQHERPLLDALEHGYTSVEADIFLADLGRGPDLHVGHDREDLTPERTLRALYLDPLARHFQGFEASTRQDSPLILLVDIKSAAESTWRELDRQLTPYASILTSARDGKVVEMAVTVIVSGNRPRQLMLEQAERLTFYDGRLEEIEDRLPPSFMPLISASWDSVSEWRGDGPLPDRERRSLHWLIQMLHEQGYLVRFWGIPDSPSGWREMINIGVDLIGTDDLAGLERFLRSSQSP